MSENEREELVDELLDASLRRYAEVELRPGFEERLLASVPERAQRFAWPQWTWIPAAATAGALLVFVVFYAARPALPPSTSMVAQQPPAIALPAPAVMEPAPVVAPRHIVRRAPIERVSAAGPRLETFPARAPLSEQERLLLLFVQLTPKEQLMARQLGAAPIEPLAIRPLNVAPLEIQKPTTEN